MTPRLVLYQRAERRPTVEEQIVICPAVVQEAVPVLVAASACWGGRQLRAYPWPST